MRYIILSKKKIKIQRTKEVRKIIPDNMQRCYKCKEIKLLTEFYNDKTRATGKAAMCKVCDKLRSKSRKLYIKKWLNKHPDYMKNYNNNEIYQKMIEDGTIKALIRRETHEATIGNPIIERKDFTTYSPLDSKESAE